MGEAIRSARLTDVGSVLSLWAAAGAVPSRTDTAQSLTALMAHDPSSLLVAEDGGVVVGSVIAGWDGWRGSIYRLVVAPSHRRTGLGRRLVHEAETRLAAGGAVRLQATVVRTESRAMEFWRGSDWHQQPDATRFVKG